MTPSNDTRAEFAASALAMYGLKKEGRAWYDAPEDMAADLMCDLLHFIRSKDADPELKLKTAKSNFEAEEAEDRPAQELTI